MKVCNRCSENKILNDFYINPNNGNVRHICKRCFKINKAKYQSKNRKKANQYHKKFMKDKPKLNLHHWVLNYLRKRNRVPNWLNYKQILEIKEIYKLCEELQWLSDPTDPLVVDHIVPINGKNISGLHVPWNLQILTRSQNCKKFNKF